MNYLLCLLADLLYSSQAEAVLLLEGCSLQHQMLLLSCIHLLQVLCCCVGLSMQCLLEYLQIKTGAKKMASLKKTFDFYI